MQEQQTQENIEENSSKTGLFDNQEQDNDNQEGAQSADEQTDYTPKDKMEEEAIKRGWRPDKTALENPDEWVSAKEFMYRRELSDKLHDKSREIKRINKELEDYKKSVQNVEKIIVRREELARQQERDAILRERREAIQNGDVEAVERLDEKIVQLEPVKPAQPQQSQELPAETIEWLEQHKSNWFNKNSLENIEMMEEAARVEERFGKYNSNASVSEILQAVEKEIRRKYPHRFKNPNLDRKQEVESSGEYVSSKKNKIDYGKITAAAREIGAQLVRKGVYKNIEEYYQDYLKVN